MVRSSARSVQAVLGDDDAAEVGALVHPVALTAAVVQDVVLVHRAVHPGGHQGGVVGRPAQRAHLACLRFVQCEIMESNAPFAQHEAVCGAACSNSGARSRTLDLSRKDLGPPHGGDRGWVTTSAPKAGPGVTVYADSSLNRM